MNVTDSMLNKTFNETDIQLSSWVYTSIAVYMSTVGIFCIVGNVTVLAVFTRLQQTVKVFIVNLAVADLIEASLGYPLAAHSSFMRRWMYGDVGCSLYGFVCFTCSMASIFTHCMIAFHRYLVVCYPNADSYFKSRKGTLLLIGVCWFCSLIWACQPLLGWGSYTFEGLGTTCTLDWRGKRNLAKIYIISTFFVVLVIPSTLTITFYGRVVKYTRSQIFAQPVNVETNNSNNELKKKINLQMLKILFFTMVAFLAIWLPYGIISIIRSTGVKISTEIEVILTMLAKFQCAINPLVYAFTSAQWYKKFKAFFTRQTTTIQPVTVNVRGAESSI